MLSLIVPTAALPEATVVAFGDSLTQGYGLSIDDGFVPQMQNWLSEQGADARVVNAGVSGDTTAGGLARIDWTLTEETDALIVALGGNDVLRGLPPDLARANLDGILSAAGERGIPVLLVGIRAPGNFGPEYQTAFERIFTDLAEKHGALLYPDFLDPLTRLNDRDRVLRDFMQADGIHPNAAGVALIVKAMGPSVLDLVKTSGRS